MSKINGGCLCGQVRYTTDAPAAMTAVCHCKNCQRQSGSAFSILVAVPKGSLRVQGELASFADRGESGLPVVRKFCARCGSPILSEVGATPELDWIKAGTLDDCSWLQPTVNLWCDSAQPWVTMAEGSAKLPRNPPPG